MNHVRSQGLTMTSGGRRVVGLVLAAWLFGLIPAAAQEVKPRPPAPKQEQKAPIAEPKAAAKPAAPEQEVFSYRSEGRRDPFLTLVRRGSEGRSGSKRPEGVAGLAVAEITLKGVLTSKGALLAMVQGPDLRTYIVHPNDRLLDGTIKAILPDSIVIVQDVNDPLSLTKQREIRKTLRVAEEVK